METLLNIIFFEVFTNSYGKTVLSGEHPKTLSSLAKQFGSRKREKLEVEIKIVFFCQCNHIYWYRPSLLEYTLRYAECLLVFPQFSFEVVFHLKVEVVVYIDKLHT